MSRTNPFGKEDGPRLIASCYGCNFYRLQERYDGYCMARVTQQHPCGGRHIGTYIDCSRTPDWCPMLTAVQKEALFGRTDVAAMQHRDAAPGLSDFIRNASPEEKERVYEKVIDDANEAQRLPTKDDDQKATQGPYVPGQERSGKSPETKVSLHLSRDYVQEVADWVGWYVTWEDQIPKVARDAIEARLRRSEKGSE